MTFNTGGNRLTKKTDARSLHTKGKDVEVPPTLSELSDADKVRLFDRMLTNTSGLTQALGRTGNGGVGKAGSYLEGRRSLAYELYDRGLLNEQRLALEILFLLPEGFLNFYQELFHRALRGGGQESVMHGRSGGLEKAKGQRGMTLGSEVGTQASGSGKKYKNTPMLIGSEKALRVKGRVDAGLIDLVRSARDELERLRIQAENGAEGRTQGPSGKLAPAACANCHRYTSAAWLFCPTCGTALDMRAKESR